MISNPLFLTETCYLLNSTVTPMRTFLTAESVVLTFMSVDLNYCNKKELRIGGGAMNNKRSFFFSFFQCAIGIKSMPSENVLANRNTEQ
jgi:hypothetical protein